jgi:ArsR family transcriptional regulator
MDMKGASSLYRLLGDDVRLRILRLLARERLNVTELTSVLGLAQSGVSRHLGLLRDSGLVDERREGGFTYYRAALPAANGLAPVWDLLGRQFAEATDDPGLRADDSRLKEVLRVRKESFAAHGGGERQLVPGRSWAAWARALGLLLPPCTVADLGCGDGYLAVETSRWASRVIAVDRSREVLDRARALALRRDVRNIDWRRGELEALPLDDGAVDVALLSQALHHAADPAKALAEARRVLVPGGRLLVLDLRRHEEAWVRERLGDRWLGFADEELALLLEGAGFRDVRIRVGARLPGDPFTVLIAVGTNPPGDTKNARTRSHAKAKTNPRSNSRIHSKVHA